MVMGYDTYGQHYPDNRIEQGSEEEIMDGIRQQLQVLRNRWQNIVGEREYIGRYLDCAVAGMIVEVEIRKGRPTRQAIKNTFRDMEGHA